MTLVDDLPGREQLTSALSGLIGDPSSGTGIAGVLALLEEIDPAGLRSGLTGSLATVSFDGGDAGAPAQALLTELQAVAGELPEDPAALVAPLTGRLGDLAALVRTDLAASLAEPARDLVDLHGLLPSPDTALLAGPLHALEAVKAQFLTGRIGRLRSWAEDLGGLDPQIGDSMAGFVEREAAEIVRLVLPGSAGPADNLAARLSTVLTADRVAALEQRKLALIAAMTGAVTTARLDLAGQAFAELTGEITAITGGLAAALDDTATGPAGIAAALDRQYAHVEAVEIVDLGSIGRQVSDALADLRETVAAIDLAGARADLDRVVAAVREGGGRLTAGGPGTRLDEIRARAAAAADGLDGMLLEIVATVRAVFGRFRDALRALAGALGDYDEQGRFHFHAQRQIEDFLTGVRRTADDTLAPLLTGFRDALRSALDTVTGLLGDVTAQVATVQGELRAALQGAADRLRELDVPGKVDDIAGRLDAMLSGLGELDFDVVTNPVVAQIEEMRDRLREIDTSALNGLLREALRAAVGAVVSIDFPGQITAVLLAELDKLLEVPKQALATVQARVADALSEVGRLAPDELLRPLDDLFQPVSRAVDQLDVDSLVAPVAQWHAGALAEIDRLAPAVLLQPVTDAYRSLDEAAGELAPERLLQPLEAAVAGFRAELDRLDLAGLTGGLGGAVRSMRAAVDGLRPEAVLAPLLPVYDAIAAALDAVDPGTLLAPVKRLSDRLAGALDTLTPIDAGRAGAAFAPVAALPARFDPALVFAAAAGHWSALRDTAQRLDVGRLLAELRGPYQALVTALPAGAGEDLAARVAALNPLRNQELGAAAGMLQQLQPRLDGVFRDAVPPAGLVTRYEPLRARLESLVPAWARGPVTPETIRGALAELDLTGVEAEARSVLAEIRAQFAALDPRPLGEMLREGLAALDGTLAALSPEALAATAGEVVAAIGARLDLLDPRLLADEVRDLADEVRGILGGLDPAGIVAALDELTAGVRAAVAGLDPAVLLAQLREPLDQVRALLGAFSPRVFREALQMVFAEIQSILAAIDLGRVLAPLVARLDALRTELKRSLDRTGIAFNDMIAAIPL
ncbi:hypothetical protein ACTI_85560 [Actinoplanes sp. OR16]|uniref:hypothetical protein n=1 Tax=Actinoplanes sp. OR16 TaxID=946334 RepID=UPI000F701EA8|nr:hypothetical protein [Actinoplanes sp. OR16]BBH71871.1 hypothetical protein ACTI_85560 [Actinoplanes sp. OR16]